MYLEIRKSNNKFYLYKAASIYDKGKIKKKRIPLGELEFLKQELKDITDDPIKYYKELFEQEKLQEKINNLNQIPIKNVENIKLKDDEFSKIEDYLEEDKNLGCIFLSKIYHKLYFNDICKKIKQEENTKLPLDKVLQLKIFSRVLDPSSKYNDFKNKDNFAENFNVSKDDIYKSLNYFYKHKNKFIEAIHNNISKIKKIDTKLLHTDASNIYVYTKEANDEDNIENSSHLLKKGYSKEGKRLPIAQFMYITDANGIPLNFKAYNGNKPDVSLYNDFINETKNIYNFEKSIIVADAGFVSNDNIVNTIISKNHYIFKESMLRLNKSMYNSFKSNILPMIKEIEKENDNFKGFYKSFNIEIPRKVTDIYGKIREVKVTQKYIFLYSKKYNNRHSKIRVEELKKVEELIKDKKKFDNIIKKLSSSLTKIINSNDIRLEVDNEKIEKFEETSGFSVLITDMIDMDEKEIIRVYRNQYLIEESFRNLKSNFEIRPVFLRKENSILSHMLICFFALLFTKLIYIGLDKEYSIYKIQEALQKLRLVKQDFTMNRKIVGYNLLADKISKLLDVRFEYKYVSGSDVRKLFGENKK